MTIAPIRATNNTRDAISNGMAQRVNNELAKSLNAGLWAWVLSREPIRKEGMSTPKTHRAARAAKGHWRLSEIRGYSEPLVNMMAKSSTMIIAPP